MDFSLSSDLQDLQQRTRRFIRERIMPLESDPRQTAHGPTEDFRRELVALGREAGLIAPHVSPEFGGPNDCAACLADERSGLCRSHIRP